MMKTLEIVACHLERMANGKLAVYSMLAIKAQIN
jgi:hypothetical protein